MSYERISNDAAKRIRATVLGWEAMRLRRAVGGGGTVPQQTPGILVKNITGYALPSYSIVGLSEPIWLPTTDELEALFLAQVGMKAVPPASPEYDGKFAVLLEPIADDGFGMAAADGIVSVKINVTDDGDETDTADIEDEESDYLVQKAGGSAQILWKDAGEGEKWAVVRIGGGAGSSVLKGVLDEPLTQYDTATVSIHDSEGATGQHVEATDWMLADDEELPTGTHVVVAWCSNEWIVINSACPPPA